MKKTLCFSVLTLLFSHYLTAASSSEISIADAAMNRDLLTVRTLLEQSSVNPDAPGKFETPAIHWLVQYNELDTVRLLLEKGSDPNLRNHFGATPLTLAITHGSAAMVQLLLEAGADANTLEQTGVPVLMTAAQSGVLNSVIQLVSHGAVVDARDQHFGQSALMIAAIGGHGDIAQFLLDQGADANAQTMMIGEETWVPPNSQRGYGFGIGIIRGGTPADRGRRDALPGGMTPLLYAARQDHTDLAEILLNAGALINQTESNGMYPLLMAISNNNMATARFLIEQGSQINVSDWYGRSPLWEAVNVRNLYVDSETFLNYVDREPVLELIKALLDSGADVNARTAETPPFRNHFLGVGSLEWVDFTGQTPFLSAALSGDVTVMNLLLEHGADPTINTYEGTSPLMAAAGINWVVGQTYTESPENLLEAVRLCFELGMDVNQTNSMGLAAIHGAANRGSNDIIQFLVDQGARLDVLDKEERSPLTWARGVFLATHPAEEKAESMVLLAELLQERGMEVR